MEHYDQVSTAQDYARQQLRAASTIQPAPLTAALRDSTDNNLGAARRTFSTLSELRNRLLGYPPPSPVGASLAKDTEPSSFADAMRRSNGELSQQLQELEVLAQEMAERL